MIMENFTLAYVPVGVPTFELVSAGEQFEKSKNLLSSLCSKVLCPDEMLLSLEKLTEFLDGIEPDLIVFQNVTFANSAYIGEVLKRFSCPLLLWTLREPAIDGTRLRLNSLTGAFSAANMIKGFRKEQFGFIFGSPNEAQTKRELEAYIKAAKVKKELNRLKMASVGHTPQGFGFGRALDLELLKNFGVTLESIEARELIDRAKAVSEEDAEKYLSKASSFMNGLENTPKKNALDFARLYKAYSDYTNENRIGALSSRCWPDFFTSFGTPVCAVLSILGDLGVAAACEADSYGALSMFVAMRLSGGSVFFGDPVSLDEEENTVTFWHCGMAACSLAREDTGACVGVHCNRKIGPTMEFGCKKSEKVTVFRIGKKSDGSFRFFIASGSALDKPKQFFGTSVVVKTENPSRNLVEKAVRDGWEPHFVVAYGDISRELSALCEMLNMEICEY